MSKDKEEAKGEPTETHGQTVEESPVPGERSTTQEYMVLVNIGGAGDAEVFLPGSRITLDDERARVHLLAGNIQPLDHTEAPVAPTTVQVIHDAPLTRKVRR